MTETVQVEKKKAPVKKKQFDINWKLTPFKRRGLKFLMQPSTLAEDSLVDLQHAHKDTTNLISQHILSDLQAGLLEITRLKKPDTKFADNYWKAIDSKVTKISDFHMARQKRGACFHAIRFYRGYLERNSASKKTAGIPHKAPRLRKVRSTYLEDGIVTHRPESNSLLVTVCGKEGERARKVEVPYTIPKGMAYKVPYLSQFFGGNLVCHKGQWMFVALATVPFEWLYDPIMAIGFDCNKEDCNWMQFSIPLAFRNGKDKIPHSAEMKHYCKLLTQLNKEIRDKQFTSSQRRGIRKKWKNAHRKLEALIRPFCEEIVNLTIEKKALLCIDELACGAQTGSFGQDKIVKLLTKMCEDRRVPFVHVPTPYTSKACNKCGAVCNRPHPNSLTCPKCGPLSAHGNAAANIADWGWKIWKEGVAKHNKWIQEVYKKRKKPVVVQSVTV